MGYIGGGVSGVRLTRHMHKVLSIAITNVLSSGEVCPELNELGFAIEKVSHSLHFCSAGLALFYFHQWIVLMHRKGRQQALQNAK